MYENMIQNKLQALKRPFIKTGDEWCMTTCLNPAHNDTSPSLSINLKTGAGRCFGCGFSISPTFWVDGEMDEDQLEQLSNTMKYKKLKERLKKEETAHSQTFLPPRAEELQEGWRGLSKETIKQLDLYICRKGKYADRIIFPMADKDGNIVAFNSRLIDGVEASPKNPKYKYSYKIQPHLLAYPNIPFRPKKPFIVLVEGIMDAITMNQAGIPAIFNFGVNYTFSDQKIAQLIREGVETIYLGLDNDAAGRRGTLHYLLGDVLIKGKPVSKISQDTVDYLYNKFEVHLPAKKYSPLSNFFEVRLAQELPELQDYYNSGAKDFNEYYLKHYHQSV